MDVVATKGMTGFVVDADAEGIDVGKKEINMGESKPRSSLLFSEPRLTYSSRFSGQRCSDTRMISFTDVFVRESRRLELPSRPLS